MYFHVVYGGARRRYGGAGRNSHKEAMAQQAENLIKRPKIRSRTVKKPN